jgi:hypothetical protein
MPSSTNTVAHLGPQSSIIPRNESLSSFGRLTCLHLL